MKQIRILAIALLLAITTMTTLAQSTNPVRPASLCYVAVGFDSAIWASSPWEKTRTTAIFWFAAHPGTPIEEGTTIWGLAYTADPTQFSDWTNVVAVTSSQTVFDEAMASETPGVYNYPTMEGGVRSGDVTLYRLTDDTEAGACGPIVPKTVVVG